MMLLYPFWHSFFRYHRVKAAQRGRVAQSFAPFRSMEVTFEFACP
ncbi:unnamed protein product [Amoebophrya sp. A25]|nr:unnamed protein product [Amoebophrya sp. A25]|eukprot:GSA25T00010376001.1